MAEEQRRPIKYGDVFEMTGEMAEMPISPRDAAAMETAENRAFGKTLKGGPAALMSTAAAKNVQAGLVGPYDSSGAVPGEQSVAEPHAHAPTGSSSALPPADEKEHPLTPATTTDH